MEPKLFVAGKAFISHNKKILIIRESKKYKDRTTIGKYDIPGGRMEPGEKFTDALIREVKEETGLNIEIGNPFAVNEWHPILNNELCQVIGIFFECKSETDKVELSEDHDDFKWINAKDYRDYNIIDNMHRIFDIYLSNKMIKGSKLVRDKIPDIIKQRGKSSIIHIADDKEYWQRLKEKLLEEVKEFSEKNSEEEFIDILEVLEAVKEFKKFDKERLHDLKNKKAIEKGKFKNRIILEGVK